MNRSHPRPTPFAVLFALTALVVGCRRGHGGDAGEGGESTVLPEVRAGTAVAQRQAFAQQVRAIGTVVARPGRSAALSAPAPTRVTHVFVVPGQPVRVGTPLVEFDRAPFDAAARSADVALETARHAYERAQRLTVAGILARKDLDQAASDLAQAESQAVTARRAQEFATLRSPINGVVTRLSAVLGAPADPGQAVVEVADPSALDLLYAVTPSEAALVHPGAPIAVSAGQQESGDPLGAATVSDVGAVVDTASRSVLVRAHLAHPVRALRIGETVFGRITVGVRPDAVVIPIEALVPEGEAFRVFVLDSASFAHARAVEVGSRTEQLAEITKGLSAGEVVVTTGAYGVQDSAKVIPLSPAERTP